MGKKKKINFNTINIIDSFDKIKKVHKDIPEFDFGCRNCPNNCCVSPYISIIEFIYVSRYILKNFSNSNEILMKDNGRNKDGILMCPFLDSQKRCLIYPVRHYKCRITGMDILDDIFTDVCQNKKEIGLISPEITKKEWYGWVELLIKANKDFKYQEQKTFQSWIDFYFEDDNKLSLHEIRIRQVIKDYLNIEKFIPYITIDDF
jgi:Fe-S-cluster containining protein